MKDKFVYCLIVFSLWIATGAQAQVVLNPNATRVVGHPQVPLFSLAPNLVEGRELHSPTAVAVDTSVQPSPLYVSDRQNNRVLAWRDAARFSTGARADLVIGQRDRFTTFSQGPGGSFSTGLNQPTGLVVDAKGNLYVVDGGNNRILRFPQPFMQTGDLLPDLVIGQTSFNTRDPNTGGVSARTLFFSVSSTLFTSYPTFDAQGNLYVPDPGNNRVLRFPASVLGPGAGNAPPADLVIGQQDFVSNQNNNQSGDPANRTALFQPSGVAVDPAGRLYVSDGTGTSSTIGGRVVVFVPPFNNQAAAARFIGVVPPSQPTPPPVSDFRLNAPEGLFMIGSNLGVVDAGNHRILIYRPFEQWTSDTLTQPALALIGQPQFSVRQPNEGLFGARPDSLASPLHATFAANELFVADAGNNRVLVFDFPGGSVPVAGATATRVLGQDKLDTNAPNLIEGREFRFTLETSQGTAADAGLAIDLKSDPPHLYVADPFNNRVLGFRDIRKLRPGDKADLVIGQVDFTYSLINSPSGDPNRPNDTGLFSPSGVAVDADGNVWVADTGNGRVLRFPRPFDQLASGTQQRPNLVLGQRDFSSKLTDPTRQTMSQPYSLAFTGGGANGLLVSDVALNRVLFFSGKIQQFTNYMPASNVFGQAGFFGSGTGSDDNRMRGPRHIASDPDDRLYVADTGNNRILIFDRAPTAGSDPRPAVILRNTVSGQAPLSSPRGIYVNPKTAELWVADTGNNRVVRYPRFNDLPLMGFSATDTLPAVGPLALAQGTLGDIYVADFANRIAMYYPALLPVNGAHYLASRPLAPGTIATICSPGSQCTVPVSPGPGVQFTSETAAFTQLPLPTVLKDIQVLMNGQPAPLFYVSPAQINFLVPMSAPSSGVAEIEVVRMSTGQVVASGLVRMDVASPALFTQGSTGTGQIAAVNQDGKVNSAGNPARAGDYISLYGTGQGFVAGAPPDGTAPTGPVSTDQKPRVIINTGFVNDSDVQYSGLAPGFPGLWQVNVRIPANVPPSNSVLVVLVYKSIPSNGSSGDAPGPLQTTIAVKQ